MGYRTFTKDGNCGDTILIAGNCGGSEWRFDVSGFHLVNVEINGKVSNASAVINIVGLGLALMEAASFCAGVRCKRYSGQQDSATSDLNRYKLQAHSILRQTLL